MYAPSKYATITHEARCGAVCAFLFTDWYLVVLQSSDEVRGSNSATRDAGVSHIFRAVGTELQLPRFR